MEVDIGTVLHKEFDRTCIVGSSSGSQCKEGRPGCGVRSEAEERVRLRVAQALQRKEPPL
jgi:hypothetical protein